MKIVEIRKSVADNSNVRERKREREEHDNKCERVRI